MTYPDGKQVLYDYDAADQLIKVTDWNHRETVYGYDNNGRLSSVLRPNSTQITRVYNDAGQLKQQQDILVATGAVISQFDFSYDAAGNISQELVVPASQPPQLTLPTDMTYGLANRLASYNQQAVQFDADGNMVLGPLSGNMENFVFDSRNRLVQAGSTVYQYDAENQRIGVDDTQYVVNSQPALSQVLVRTKGNGEVTYYVYGLGLIGQASAGNYVSYHFDYRGSTVALSDEVGQVTERFQYSPFGTFMYGDASRTPFLFNGMYGVMSDDNGLYYMRARFYSPEIRRFVNQDILLGDVFEGQSLNRFGFVTGQPVNLVDPFGLDGVDGEDVKLGMAISSLFIPGPGEVLDIDTLFGITESTTSWDKLGAGSSLILSVVTLGTSPNYGFLKCFDDELILNIGSGNRPIEGAINLDLFSGKGVDIIADVGVNAEHLPFKAETFDKIVAQALPSLLLGRYGEKVIKNIFAALKQGGTVVIHSNTEMGSDIGQFFLNAGFTEVIVEGNVVKARK